ncbi:MAG: hypothetical protein AAGA59_20005 [Actinomycetota bacterium]
MNRTSLGAGRMSSQLIPILDRSRSRLRIPENLLPEALEQVSGRRLASPVAVVRMESGGIMVDGNLDPLVTAMLKVIDSASLVVSVHVMAHGDTSLTTIHATPQRAVVTSSLDPDLIDVAPLRITRMPETLSDMILLRQPESVGSRPIRVPANDVARAEQLRNTPDMARAVLAGAGLDEEAIGVMLALQNPGTRQWRISSTWAVGDEQADTAELRGVDAGPAGQWLLAGSVERAENTLTLTPQGDGEVLRSLRRILPQFWVGTPLKRQATTGSRR